MTNDVYTLYRLAQRLLADRDGAAAIPLLENAAEQLPGDQAILRLLALAYNDAGALSAAESTLRILVRQDPLDADALHMLGKALERTGRTAEAGGYLSLAASLDPAYSASCSVWGATPRR
ncbi:MAG: tetratricopeptide repeat protein [Actinomycetota bacterium]